MNMDMGGELPEAVVVTWQGYNVIDKRLCLYQCPRFDVLIIS